MKLFSKLSKLTFTLFASFALTGSAQKMVYENSEDINLNNKLLDLKLGIEQQKADLPGATDMFRKVFPDVIEGQARVKTVYFEDGNTSLVVTESPIPLKILFRGQFLLDNKVISEKTGKVIKFRISTADVVPEPILLQLRRPLTDSPYWLHLTFSNYGEGTEGDYVDNLKPDTIK